MFDFLINWIISIPGVNFIQFLCKNRRKMFICFFILMLCRKNNLFFRLFLFWNFLLIILLLKFLFLTSFFGEFSLSNLSIKRYLKNIRILGFVPLFHYKLDKLRELFIWREWLILIFYQLNLNFFLLSFLIVFLSFIYHLI